MKRTIAKIGILTGLIAALTMALAACSADPTATPRPAATSAAPTATATTVPTATPEPEYYWELFVRSDSDGKAGLVTCIPGWECTKRNEQQVYGYGLDEVIELINPGSFESMNAEIQRAFEREENILFYYWAPTALMTQLQTEYGGIVRLEEPASTEECEQHISENRESGDPEDVTIACEYADAEVLAAVHSDLLDSAPDAVEFLGAYELSDLGIGELLVRKQDSGDENADVAAWWLQTSDEWKSWVSDDVAQKVLAGLGGDAMTPDSSKTTLVFAGLNWTSAALQNAVARAILEYGYGYPTDEVSGGTIPLMLALTQGDVNVNMEIWLPNQQAAWDDAVAAGTVTNLGTTLAGKAWQSAFIIPQYTADANPGLRSVSDLLKVNSDR